MPKPAVPAAAVGATVVVRPDATGPRIAEPRPRPQYRGLFLEPDWPTDDDPDPTP